MIRIIKQIMPALYIAALMSGFSISANAANPICDSDGELEWISEQDVLTMATQLGYTIETLSVSDGNCYFATTVNEVGEDVELFFDPVTGTLVKGAEPSAIE